MSADTPDDLLAGVRAISAALRDPQGVRVADEVEYNAKRARLDVLIEDRRVEELPDGLLRYHLTTSIKMGPETIEALTFKRPTVGTIRSASRFGTGTDEWAAFLIKTLCKEIPDDRTLNQIDGSEWDDVVEVVQFPFAHTPCRTSGENPPDGPASSGSKP